MAVTKKMTEGNPAKIIFFFALPLMLGNLFNQLYYVVDTAIVGRFVGVKALSAVGATDWLNYFFTCIVMLFPQGFGILIARVFGKKDKKELNLVIQNSVFLVGVIMILVAIIGQIVLVPCLKLINTPSDIINLSETYMRIILAGVPLNMLYNIMASILRALGDSKSPLIAMIIASIINIGLDLVFIINFKWGIAGAAFATILAQGASAVITTFFVLKHRLFTFRGFKVESRLVKQLLLLALPVALQGMIISIGGLAIQNVVNGYGNDFIAGITATNKLYGLLEICATSYGLGITTYVSQNYGAHKFSRIQKGTNIGALMSVATSLVVTVAMLLAGRMILNIFIEPSAVNKEYILDIGFSYLSYMLYFLAALYLLYNYRSAIQGLGNTIIPMLSGVVELIVRVVCAYTLPLLVEQKGIYLAEILAWLGACLLLIPAYYILFKRHHNNYLEMAVLEVAEN